MPLKKPNSLPKFAKPRKKTIEKLKEVIPAKKTSEIEYKCKIYFKFNQLKKVQQYVFALETEKLFANMKYGITTQVSKSKRTIDISISGLTPIQTYFVEPGPAVNEIIFDNLFGEYTINVLKKDGSINSAVINFNVFKKEIKVIDEFLPPKKNNRKFCSFIIDSKNFTFE